MKKLIFQSRWAGAGGGGWGRRSSTPLRLSDNIFQLPVGVFTMPVYLDFLQVAKKKFAVCLRDPNLSALLEACKSESGNKEFFFELC